MKFRPVVIFILIALTLALLFSCNPGDTYYKRHQHLSPNVEWLRSDVRSFEVPITDTNLQLSMAIAFRYATAYPFDYLKIKLKEISPSGEVRLMDFELKIKDDNGKPIGEPGFDIWDSEHLVVPSFKYPEKGNYRYELTHDMPKDELHYAMEIGLVLEKGV